MVFLPNEWFYSKYPKASEVKIKEHSVLKNCHFLSYLQTAHLLIIITQKTQEQAREKI
jgi:hypothetical protein